MTTTTANTFDRMTRDDRWLGFGYLGGRQSALWSDDPGAPAQPHRVAGVDAWLLGLGLGDEALFEWANSKKGRHFADVVFGGGTIGEAIRFRLAPVAA